MFNEINNLQLSLENVDASIIPIFGEINNYNGASVEIKGEDEEA